LPIFRFDKVLGIARDVKAFLSSGGGIARRAVTNAERREERTRNRKEVRRRASEHKKRLRGEIKSKKRELSRIRKEPGAAKRERKRTKRTKKTVQQELFELERELRAAKERRAAKEPVTGALPDFVVIGAMKAGTSSFYHLLTQHPYVERAAAKELHFFNSHFNLGVEWYRRCFPQPRLKDGRRTITGEATPGYLRGRLVPVRMAKVIPRVRLIALLRNPVDRTYSDYQQGVRKGRETRTFEEAIGFEEATIEAERTQPLGGDSETSVHEEDYVGLEDSPHRFLSKSIYVDQLLRWSEFFPKEQLLVLKSEDFFEHPLETLKTVQGFLDLPEWEPRASELPKKRNEGKYEEGIDPATRRLLEEYFEPHNQRLYDFLGADFRW
jgi:hypothetical protein